MSGLRRLLVAVLLLTATFPGRAVAVDNQATTTTPPTEPVEDVLTTTPVVTVSISRSELGVDTAGDPTITGPTVTIDPAAVKPTERVAVAISGFQDTVATIAVCGNDALRGSQDCNMVDSYSLRVGASYVQGLSMLISEPPASCPCIIRVTSNGNEEIALTPITIIGHPVGPLVGPATIGELVGVSIHASQSPTSFWGNFRPNLGGATPFDVTVSIHNTSTATLHNLDVNAAVGHGDTDYVADITFGRPDAVAPGQTWKQTVRTVVKSPAIGTLRWRVAVSGAGPTVTANQTMRRKPVLLMVACLIIIGAIFVLIIRLLISRHVRRAERNAAAGELPAAGQATIEATAVESLDSEPVLAG